MNHAWPRAIIHADADAFFASVAQAMHPEYKGKPVIIGAERGVVVAASYEAKALGVDRGVPLSEVTRRCPHCILLPGDYEAYTLYSERLFEIFRRFTPQVEEYSIDEAFGDLTGLRRSFHGPYHTIAQQIQETVRRELDITVSVGVSLSKVLAKLCSKFRKPAGLTVVSGRQLHGLLAAVPLEKVWGFGPSTVALLQKQGMRTPLDFVRRSELFAKRLLGKVGVEMWHELRGESVFSVSTERKQSQASVSKFRTFSPPSRDRDYLFAQLLRNVESACIKVRQYRMAARSLGIILRQQDFESYGLEAKIEVPTSSPLLLTGIVETLFAKIFRPGRLYRATGIVLADLQTDARCQYDLFHNPRQQMQKEKIGFAIDNVAQRYGKHTLFLANGLMLEN